LTPAFDRTIEVAATLLVDHRPMETFHQLMRPGMSLPSFITSLTGITNEMLRGQPSPEQVMPRLRSFLRGLPIVAHNAAFDRGFLRAEYCRAGLRLENEFLCTMRLARRLVPDLPTYRLDALVDSLRACLKRPDRARRGAAGWMQGAAKRRILEVFKRAATQPRGQGRALLGHALRGRFGTLPGFQQRQPTRPRPVWRRGGLFRHALRLCAPDVRQFHRSLADVNHTVGLWQSLHARFTEQTGLQHPPISTLDALMRKPKKQVPNYLAALRSPLKPTRPARTETEINDEAGTA
jgi:hypothetical protein